MDNFDNLYNTFLPEPLKGPGKNKTADCPFCEAAGKFSVDVTTSVGQCLHAACGVKTNHITFLTKFHQAWLKHTTDQDYEDLAEARGISVETLKSAQLAWDNYTGKWLVPYANPFTDNLTNLGYFFEKGKNAFKIFKAPNVRDELPLTFYNPFQQIKTRPKGANKNIYICEGEWDTLALLDLIRNNGLDDYHPVIIGVPGAAIFPEHCKKWFDKFDHGYGFYDNDEAGEIGRQKAANILRRWQKGFHAVDWEEVQDAEENWDIRDMLINRPETALSEMMEAMVPIEGTINETNGDELSPGYVSSVADIDEVETWDEFIDVWDTNQHISDTNRDAIALTMAIATCQYMHGEPLWFFLVGPAGCGKTTMIEAFGGENEYFDYASRITSKSLVSGFAGADTSLVPKMNGKTFFIKDFTVVLGMPADAQREVFNLFRDIYDGTCKIPFGNGKVVDLSNVRFNLIAGVTDAIKKHNDASMGERFLRLDYVGDDIDHLSIIDSALSGFGQTSERKRILTEATLGYVKTVLREDNRWDVHNLPRLSATSRKKLSALAMFTAGIRTRPENDRNDGLLYRPRQEIAGRLALQFAKVGFAVEKVFDPTFQCGAELDFTDRTLNLLGKVVHDTADGFAQDFVKYIHLNPRKGRKDMELALKLPSTRIHRIITDLKATNLLRHTTVMDDKSRNRDPKGRPTEYYFVNDDFKDVCTEIWGPPPAKKGRGA